MKRTQKIYYYLLLILTYIPINIFSQNHQVDSFICKPQFDSVAQIEYYFVVDSMPEFPGGKNEMLNFFMTNFNYPSEIDACCKIYIEFIIDTTGKMINIKIIRGLQEDFDNETVRVLKMMPNWKPGKCNGIPVNVKYLFPLNISLQ